VRDPKVFKHYLDLVDKKKTGTASSS
jgi:hypothetical protein